MSRGMFILRVSFLSFLSFALLSSCGGSGSEGKTGSSKSREDEPVFVLPKIPTMISSPEDQVKYLSEHYWDMFDFKDTVNIMESEALAPIIANYVKVLVTADADKKEVVSFLERAAGNPSLLRTSLELLEKILDDPNSPLRDEDLFIETLKFSIASDVLLPEEKLTPKYKLENAMKNRPGEKAADFVYTVQDENGVAGGHKMSSISADFLLLFFTNPDCPDCHRVQKKMEASLYFKQAYKKGLKILTVFTDEDLEIWKRAHFPENWIKSYDASRRIVTEQLYDLRAIPTFYLLDRDKKVILKDIKSENLEEMIYKYIIWEKE